MGVFGETPNTARETRALHFFVGAITLSLDPQISPIFAD